jgi:hypothetical protein
MTCIVTGYLIYLPISILLTIWVGRTLFKHGRIFLVETFHGDTALADAVNRLLLTGFYLINIGYCVYTLKIMEPINSSGEMIEVLSLKIGLIILILGAMHFLNLFIFFRLRRRALDERRAKMRYNGETQQ